MKNYNNYIFDLDGTIINSAEEILKCLKLAYKNADYVVNQEKFKAEIIGPPIRQIIKKVTPELSDNKKIEEIVKNFRNIYDNDKNDISFLYDGILEFLKTLKENNKKIFIATNKPKKPTMRILEHLKILNLFNDVYCIDSYEKPMTKGEMIIEILAKYNLEKEESLMIGDAKSDIIAAKEADVNSAGVFWGYDEDKTTLEENADILIKDAADFNKIGL